MIPRTGNLAWRWATALTALLAAAGCSRPNPPPLLAFSGATMGTTYHVKLVGRSPLPALSELQRAVDRRLEQIEQRMSTYRSDSELSRFNQSAGLEWFPVSADTALVVATALALGDETAGLFDVTVGPVVNLWGFGPERRRDQIPADAEIAAAQQQVGQTHLRARQAPPALRKLRASIAVDLSAIAKGFAVDEVAEICESYQLADYLVEIGGEVRAHGHRPDGSGWRIGIEQPWDDTRAIGRAVELKDRSLATSGDYRNFFVAEGRRYSHEIDPRTGRPITHDLASVSVLADTCMQADALATAFMIMGPDEAYRFAEGRQLGVLLLIRTPQGFLQRTTPSFATAMCRDD